MSVIKSIIINDGPKESRIPVSELKLSDNKVQAIHKIINESVNSDENLEYLKANIDWLKINNAANIDILRDKLSLDRRRKHNFDNSEELNQILLGSPMIDEITSRLFSEGIIKDEYYLVNSNKKFRKNLDISSYSRSCYFNADNIHMKDVRVNISYDYKKYKTQDAGDVYLYYDFDNHRFDNCLVEKLPVIDIQEDASKKYTSHFARLLRKLIPQGYDLKFIDDYNNYDYLVRVDYDTLRKVVCDGLTYYIYTKQAGTRDWKHVQYIEMSDDKYDIDIDVIFSRLLSHLIPESNIVNKNNDYCTKKIFDYNFDKDGNLIPGSGKRNALQEGIEYIFNNIDDINNIPYSLLDTYEFSCDIDHLDSEEDIQRAFEDYIDELNNFSYTEIEKVHNKIEDILLSVESAPDDLINELIEINNNYKANKQKFMDLLVEGLIAIENKYGSFLDFYLISKKLKNRK